MDSQSVQGSPETSPIDIGCVVTLHCHPFFKENHKDTIHISGESTMIPPLMIVIEVLLERKASFEEHSGFEVSNKNTYQCKCIWYSLKSHQFEEAWLSSKLLKSLDDCTNFQQPEKTPHGTTVVLKTGYIELSKKKLTFNQFGNHNESNNTISGLLSFSSPTMLVIGTAKNEIKEPLIDSKTGRKKRWISEKLLKCKYFNPNSDKLSEVILPIEALSVVDQIGKDCLINLENAIFNHKTLNVVVSQLGFSETIIKPLRINFKGAHYFLEAKDYLTNKVIELLIDGNPEQFKEVNPSLNSLPKFDKSEKNYNYRKIEYSNCCVQPVSATRDFIKCT